jgi:hypothetical protein
MLLQKTHIMSTASSVKSDSKRPPLMAPDVPLQMCTLITNWKIWPRMKRRAAPRR